MKTGMIQVATPNAFTADGGPTEDESVESVVPLRRPRWLPESVWPFETMALRFGDASIAFAEVGRGPTLVFYTGIGAFIWRDVMLQLSADFRCVAVDPPGIGASAPVPRVSLTLENSARALNAVIRARDLKDFVLVAHDTGAPPAIVAAARIAERVRGLVSVNSFGWRPAGRPFRGMLAVMGSSAVRRIDLMTGAIARITSTNFGVGRHLDAASRRAYREGLLQELGAFHDYLNEARFSEAIYEELVTCSPKVDPAIM